MFILLFPVFLDYFSGTSYTWGRIDFSTLVRTNTSPSPVLVCPYSGHPYGLLQLDQQKSPHKPLLSNSIIWNWLMQYQYLKTSPTHRVDYGLFFCFIIFFPILPPPPIRLRFQKAAQSLTLKPASILRSSPLVGEFLPRISLFYPHHSFVFRLSFLNPHWSNVDVGIKQRIMYIVVWFIRYSILQLIWKILTPIVMSLLIIKSVNGRKSE